VDPAFLVRTDPDVDAKDALVVVGAASVGLVGPIATEYLIRQLGARPVGGLQGGAVPATATVSDGLLRPPVVAFLARGARWSRFRTLVVFGAPRGLSDADAGAYADAIATWAKQQKCGAIACLDGALTEDEREDNLVWGAAGDSAALALVDASGAKRFSGRLGGLAAAIPSAGAMRGIPSFTLLAETDQAYPDHRAAARLLRALDNVLPGVTVETGPLEAEAASIEASLMAMARHGA
jgi:uncharacterized protein